MTDWNAVSAFMANVVPWPGDPKDPGYVNLHFSTVDRKNPSGPLRKGSGWPFRSVDALVGRASWLNSTTQFKDAWYCLSLQSQTKPNTKDPSKPRAHRLAANALKLKAIWIDVDVGIETKKYPTIEDALKALITFREKAALPPFSALVGSGSGVHAYWISDVALSRTEWEAYAGGLKALILQAGMKCDAGLTTDAARILRVPGTFNHKTNPPKPVQLLNIPLVLYNFNTQLSFLKNFYVVPVNATSSLPTSIFAEGADMASFKRQPVFQIDEPDLNAGIDRYEETLLDPRPIFTDCGFYREALRTGGKDYDNALWMYSVLGATFMENGNAIAHLVSKGHETYSEADTQALYDRKVAERADRGIGYPSCSTIAGAGCKSCATCPLFQKGKSPLNIRPVVTATVTGAALNMAAPSQQTQTAKDLCLPEGYDVDANGYICEVIEQEVGGETMPPMLYQLFLCKITDPWVQSNPDCLNFTVSVDKGRVHQASIKMDDMAGMGLDRVLLKAKVKYFPKNKGRLEHFIVAWLARLHEMASAQAALPFGWYKENGNFKGFVFAGKLMKDDGSEMPCGIGDAKLREIFHPSGDIQDWYRACKIITQQKRQELDAIIALSFAAPLTALVGKNAMTMCAYGESGAGKTAAYSVGVSVWGHSKKGKAVSHSTFNQVMKSLGELGNLPMYWDEIKNAKAQAAVYDFIYNASDGVEKGRLKSDTSQQERGTWQTQMCAAANISLIDYIMKQDPSHVAGVSRVFEYNVKKVTTGPGRISQTDADVIIDKLMTSYGQVGLLYGKLLAMNHAVIKQECIDTCKQVEIDMQNTDEERFWVAQVGTLLVAARLANTLGCEFDVPALKAFLYRVYQENRTRRNNMMAVSGYKNTTEAVMTGYFAKVQTNDQALWTVGMPTGPGKALNLTLHGPKDSKNVSVTTSVAVRWDTQNRTLYVLKTHLVDYLSEAGLGVSTTLESLQRDYDMKFRPRTRIAGGTTYDSGRDTCLVFENIGPDHDWAELMYAWTDVKDRPTPSDPKPTPDNSRVETGFEVDAQPGAEAFTPEGLTPTADVLAWAQGASRGPR